MLVNHSSLLAAMQGLTPNHPTQYRRVSSGGTTPEFQADTNSAPSLQQAFQSHRI